MAREWRRKNSHSLCEYRPSAPLGGGEDVEFLKFDQAFSNCVSEEFGAVVDLQLLVDVAHVVADCLLADSQAVGDLLGRQARREQLQNLELTAAQPAVSILYPTLATDEGSHSIA